MCTLDDVRKQNELDHREIQQEMHKSLSALEDNVTSAINNMTEKINVSAGKMEKAATITTLFKAISLTLASAIVALFVAFLSVAFSDRSINADSAKMQRDYLNNNYSMMTKIDSIMRSQQDLYDWTHMVSDSVIYPTYYRSKNNTVEIQKIKSKLSL